MAKIIGLSGSLVRGGVVEKAMEKVMVSTGREWEMIRLQKLDMKYCLGCARCVYSNRCVLKDDMNELIEKIEAADAIVVGGMARFGKLNALTKNFVERLFPLFHNDVLEGKKMVTVSGGTFDQETVKEDLTSAFSAYKVNEVGALTIGGNASCFKCGKGETCSKSVFRALYGDEAKITADTFYDFEKDESAVEEARLLGEKLAKVLG